MEIDLTPDVEAKIKEQARALGVSVEVFMTSMIEGLNSLLNLNGETADDKDPRIATMREAMNDQLFLADLAETIEDFKYVDGECQH